LRDSSSKPKVLIQKQDSTFACVLLLKSALQKQHEEKYIGSVYRDGISYNGNGRLIPVFDEK